MSTRLHILAKAGLATLPILIGLTATRPATAKDLAGLNPDTLSFFEEPLAYNLFGFTLTYNQLFDAPIVFDTKRKDGEFHPRTNLRGSIERQLPNAITIGATYAASYDDKDVKKFDDRWAIYGSGVWGKLSGGKVNDTIREATRRWRGTGNAALEFDGLRGTLKTDKLGVAHQLRMSAYTFNAGIDQNGNIDLGITYERPNKFVDIRVSGRYTNSKFTSPDGITKFNTNAAGLVGQIAYGSFAGDIGLGLEHFVSSAVSGRRVYASAGLHYKVRRLTLSAEGHLGTIDGDLEKSAALGARYDIARGLSFNLGYNYAKTNASIDGVAIQRLKKSQFISSVRYEF